MTLPTLTLRNKLMVFAALLVLVPGILIGVLAERSGRTSLQAVIGGRLAREARHTAEHLASLLRAERDALNNFAHQDMMREMRIGDFDKRISRALATLSESSAVRVEYLALDERRQIVSASRPGLLAESPAWVSDDTAAEVPRAYDGGIVLAEPIPDPDTPGATLGRLFGLIDWGLVRIVTDQLREDLVAQGIDAEVFLIGPDGRMLQPSDLENTSVVRTISLPDLVSTIGGGADYSVNTTAERIVGRASLGPEVPGWRLLVAEPLAHAFAPVRALRNRILMFMCSALIVALLIATVAARRVTRPLTELTRAIEGLSRGEPAVLHVAPGTRDEVGSLAFAFNEMTAELERVQHNLVEAEKFAFVGELASGVAHEVRTSLGVLRSSAQILQRSIPRESGGNAPELVGMIRAEVDRLGGVVDDLLRLDRPRPLNLQSQPVSTSVFRAAEFVRRQAEEKGILLESSPVVGEPDVLCDSEAIQQVAMNLLVNAIDILGSGGCIRIVIHSGALGSGGFSVCDDGPGVPEALKEKIFQPFVSARDGGVGLGLTFVKRVVHEHRGRVFLDPGSGSTCFRVELPLAPEIT